MRKVVLFGVEEEIEDDKNSKDEETQKELEESKYGFGKQALGIYSKGMWSASSKYFLFW